jgi:hypothetical protein
MNECRYSRHINITDGDEAILLVPGVHVMSLHVHHTYRNLSAILNRIEAQTIQQPYKLHLQELRVLTATTASVDIAIL